jgi:hypothetical protein
MQIDNKSLKEIQQLALITVLTSHSTDKCPSCEQQQKCDPSDRAVLL